MSMLTFSAEKSLYKPARSYRAVGAAPSQGAASGVLPQAKGTFCGACLCRTVGGCGVGPFNPGWQTCVTIDTHGSLNPLNWTFESFSQPCFGAKSGVLQRNP
jgi:hypothetical protein